MLTAALKFWLSLMEALIRLPFSLDTVWSPADSQSPMSKTRPPHVSRRRAGRTDSSPARPPHTRRLPAPSSAPNTFTDRQQTPRVTDRQQTPRVTDRQQTHPVTDRQQTPRVTDRQQTHPVTDRQQTPRVIDRQRPHRVTDWQQLLSQLLAQLLWRCCCCCLVDAGTRHHGLSVLRAGLHTGSRWMPQTCATYTRCITYRKTRFKKDIYIIHCEMRVLSASHAHNLCAWLLIILSCIVVTYR